MEEIRRLESQFAKIEDKLKYQFNDKNLLVLAFIHSSYLNENKDLLIKSNERLEFLGDAVLGMIIAQKLYLNFPEKSEGTLSHLRSKIIDSASCAQYLEKLKLEKFLVMGKGEKKNFSTKSNHSIMADLFEALVGAIYLDGGLICVQKFIELHFSEDIKQIIESPIRNWKAELQDYSQKKYQKIPLYKVTSETGPDHNKTFHICVFIDDHEMGSGYGVTKKSAQQAAAQEALLRLGMLDNKK